MLHFWQACSNQLQKELTPQQFKAWIVHLSPESYDEATHLLTISAATRIKAESCAQGVAAQTPAGAGGGFAGGFEQKYRFDLAAVVVPDREDGGIALARLRFDLRMRARSHAKGEQQGKRQAQKARFHG